MRHFLASVAALAALSLCASVARAETLTYGYDELGRLVGAVSDRGPAATTTTIYLYDKADNRSVVFVAKADATKRPVFTFFEPSRGHFYTLGFLEGHNAGMDAAGPTFYLYTSGGSGRYALYRCYDAAGGNHFVTASSNCEGQTVEGILGYSAASNAAGLTELHRCFRASDTDHLVTANMAECTNYGYAYVQSLGFVP
ncbi:hypothetical protein MOK15_15485 [Sphingobium sp. BYY-5]|uniref:hypothetical protein n=1 Tax=Sphingobium sp. BYY-5 TaxID=2926400 RepID=UPI001FA794B5|nr:hypothetical protein [Sphingobium sp. BYY-5]MCI4591484.1 hypothetical protein [Sphingobium sp. BYY-5]